LFIVGNNVGIYLLKPKKFFSLIPQKFDKLKLKILYYVLGLHANIMSTEFTEKEEMQEVISLSPLVPIARIISF